MSEEETIGLLSNTNKRSKTSNNKFLVILAAALVFTSIGVVVSLVPKNDAAPSGTSIHSYITFQIHYTGLSINS